MLVIPQDQGVIDQMPDDVSDANVEYVWETLQLNIPRKQLQFLINSVNYYVPDTITSRERAKFVAQAIVELQRRVPIPEYPIPRFPDKVEKVYVERVRTFLDKEGESWVESMLQAASSPSSTDVGMTRVPATDRAQQMAERTPEHPPYAAGAYSALARSRDGGSNEATMTSTESTSTPNISDHNGGLPLYGPHVRGARSEVNRRRGLVHVGKEVLESKPVRVLLVLAFIALAFIVFS